MKIQGCGKKYKMFKDNICFVTCGFIDSEKRIYLCPNCSKEQTQTQEVMK